MQKSRVSHGTSPPLDPFTPQDKNITNTAVSAAELALRHIFKRCIECPPTTPSCPSCAAGEICSLVPYNCNECAHMTCIKNPSPAPHSNGRNVGAIAGGVVGGVAFVALVVFVIWRFWIKKRREEQDRELQEEWVESDDIAQQKFVHRFDVRASDAVSTRTRGSLANSILSRASNIIQIAYIPGVTNRNASSHTSLHAPVPPIPAAHRSGQPPPKSPLSNEGDALFFRPGDLRDSSYSATSSIASGAGMAGNRDTQYTMQSITPSLARSSMASDVYRDDATTTPMPATTVTRAAPRMVSVKSSGSSDTPTLRSSPSTPSENENAGLAGKAKSLQVMMPGQGEVGPSPNSSLRSTTGSISGRATQVTVGSKGKGRFPVRQPSDASTAASSTLGSKHAPAVSSPLAEEDSPMDSESDDLDEHARARQSLINNPTTPHTQDFASPPAVQPAESPFFDASEHPSSATMAIAAAPSTRRNPYASMSSSVGSVSPGERSPKRGVKNGIGGLSAVIEEATKRASRQPSHEGLGGRGDVSPSPFADEHSAE